MINKLASLKIKPSNINVLHLIDNLDNGVAQDDLLLTVKNLKETGFQVDIASAPFGDLQALSQKTADNLFFIRTFESLNNTDVLSLHTLFELKSLFKSQRYNIVHTYGFLAGFYGRFMARLTTTPIILHSFYGLPEEVNSNIIVKTYITMLEKYVSDYCDHIFIMNNFNAKEFKANKFADAKRYSIASSGINLDRFNFNKSASAIKEQLEIPEDNSVIAIYVDLYQDNVYQILNDLISSILKPGKNITIVILSNDNIENSFILKYVNEPGVKLLGKWRELSEILYIMDMLILLACDRDNYKIIPEAMMLNKVIIACKNSITSDFITNGVTGLLFRQYTTGEVAGKVSELLNDGNLMKIIADHAHHKAIPEFLSTEMLKIVENIYSELIERRLTGTAGF